MISRPESAQVDQLLQSERAQRPRWLRVGPPRWFRGQELDVLAKDERDRLYWKTAAANANSPWFGWLLLLVWSPKGIEHIVADQHRWLWAACMAVFALAIVAATLVRRRNILAAARRNVREAADWPLRRAASLHA